MDERARALEAEQATLTVVAAVDTRLRQSPGHLPCLVGRYDLTSVGDQRLKLLRDYEAILAKLAVF
jgi:hypothetical protein